MSTRRFFIEISDDDPRTCNTVTIAGDECHHLLKVNRAGCGDAVEATDGNGTLFFGSIQTIKAGEAIVAITNRQYQPRTGPSIVIAPSLLKQRSMAILMEKLTEIGVTEIQPLIFHHTDEKFSANRLKKWQKTAQQSLKVNKHLWCTIINEPITLDRFIESQRQTGTKILLDIHGQPGISAVTDSVVSVIGPPGGITAVEGERLRESGFGACKISDTIYKTETAAIASAAILKNARMQQRFNQD